jgi:predicted kinase
VSASELASGFGSVVIVTGSPGAGKTTLCAHLAQASPRGVHLHADDFHTYLAHPISPVLPDSHAQNATIIRACTQAASAFAKGGYEVFLDGIFGPWFLPVALENLAGLRIDYVVLRSELQQAIERAGSRPAAPADAAIVQQMHAAFSSLEPYEHHALDIGALELAAVANELQRRRAAGEFRLNPAV